MAPDSISIVAILLVSTMPGDRRKEAFGDDAPQNE
jgi:hypothetical protein